MAAIETLGEVDGVPVQALRLQGGDLRAKVLTQGARLAELWVPDRVGKLADVVLGFDHPQDWLDRGGYLGATCGRFANRIAEARFMLDGREIRLDQNEGAQQLHGGSAGFDSKLWTVAEQSESHATLTLTSPDGDMGYPGALTASVTYRIEGLTLSIVMEARTDALTVVNLAHHSYFNLAGQGSGDVLGQKLQIEAEHYLPVDGTLIPTGEVRAVADTAFDFRKVRAIGDSLPGPGGFDHNFCLSAPLGSDGLRPCLEAVDPASGRRLRLATTEPGVQFYTGGHFDSGPGKAGARYPRFAGFAIETQRFPDTPNRPQFPSARLTPGETYRHEMRFDFTPSS